MKKQVYQLAVSNKIMEQLVSSKASNSNMLVGKCKRDLVERSPNIKLPKLT
jgi:hypothetical protein